MTIPESKEATRQSRRSLIGFALALMLGAGVAVLMSASTSLIESGVAAPDFELPTADGTERVSLASLRGKVVLIDFWSTTCPPCVRQLRDLEELYRQVDPTEVVILGINTEGAPPRMVQEFATARGVRYSVLIDGGAVAEQYRVQQLPTLYLIDRQGQIRWSRVGHTPHRELAELLRELI